MFVAKNLSKPRHGKLPLYPLESTTIDDRLFHDDSSFAFRKNEGSHSFVRKNINSSYDNINKS